MIALNINDSAFAHDICSVAGRTPKSLRWVRDGSGDPRVQFYTNEKCFDPVFDDKINIAWLIESQAIIPQVYNAFHLVADKFDIILTHSSEILKKYPKAIFSPGGGIWVGGTLGGGEVKIYEKGGNRSLTSMVSSEKHMCPLHNFRYEIAQEFLAMDDLYSSGPSKSHVDVYGMGQWFPIIESLARYPFSIVIENYRDRAYFTEKILNCFATGTIPIYYGAEDIDLYFNAKGIIRFSSKEELKYILSKITMDTYRSKMEAVKENFEKCQDYAVIEDRFMRILDMKRMIK